MSLDVYLKIKKKDGRPVPTGGGIFVRVDGATKEITRAEWDVLYPGREPFVVPARVDEEDDDVTVYSRNITHNLNTMADAAGIYEALWRPDEIGITSASQLIAPLAAGLSALLAEPDKFRKFNPKNGWGTYEGLVSFVEGYLRACHEYPDAEVLVWR